MKKLIFILICMTLVGCASTKDQFAQHGYNQIFVPEHPAIFVPGLGYTGKFWEKSAAVKELRRLGWDYGGELKVKDNNGVFTVLPKKIKPAHLYTVTFSSTQLAITQQGKELAEVVKRVKEANNEDKVILIGHSMGGLASREYLQSNYYRNDVAGFVSVGTPHQGSNFDLEKVQLKLVPKFIRDLKWKVDTNGDAVRDLRPGSEYLTSLNNFALRPMPSDVTYIAIVGSGCPFIATRTQCAVSDGIVRVNSQDPNKTPGVNVQYDILTTEKDHFGEANDSWVLIKALKPLECDIHQLKTYKSTKQATQV